jgi:TetR/AcrR family transcriptional regulator, mexJK operon transcriptional repressor
MAVCADYWPNTQYFSMHFKPKKGRPNTAQVAAIERVILGTALERFLADGYEGMSMDAVALHAGISKGTLYSRYPHKAALFRALVEDRVEAWSAEATAQDRLVGNTLEEHLRSFATIMAVRGLSAESRAFDRLLNSAFGVAPEIIRMLYEMRYERGIRYLVREIRDFTHADGRPARDPSSVAITLVSALRGWITLETSLRVVPEQDAINFARHVIDLLLAARAEW